MDNTVWKRCLLLFVVGLLIALYPLVSQWFCQLRVALGKKQLENRLKETDVEAQYNLAQSYNEALHTGTQEGYEEILNFSDGMMGIIHLPKIRVELPIYHGTDDSVLAKGAGHLPESGFPIGGEGNHAVISAHTGYPGAKLFSDLNLLSIGDTFEIHILKKVLIYQVDQMLVVLPEDVQALLPAAGEDYCTLVTCTPYGINSHRLLVRGNRVK